MVQQVAEKKVNNDQEKSTNPTATTDFSLPPANAGVVTEEIKSEVQANCETLRELKNRGYTLTLTPCLTYQQDGSVKDGSDYDLSKISMKKGYQVSVAGSPYQALSFRYGKLLDKPIEMMDLPSKDDPFGAEEISVAPYLVKLSGEKENQEVKVFDYLSKDRPLIISEKGEEAIARAMDKLEDYHKRTQASKQDYLNNLEPKEGQSALEVSKNSSCTEQEKSAIKEMLGRYRFSVETEKQNGEVDRLGRDVEISKKEWEKADCAPLTVNGQVSEILLNRELSKAEIKALPANPDDAYDPVKITDQYGNQIFRTRNGNLKGAKTDEDKMVQEYIQIIPPRPFADNQQQAANARPVNFDASAVGGPKITGFISQQPLVPIASMRDYNIYSNMDESAVKELGKGTFRALAKGAKKVEKLFGEKLGGQLQNIHIVNGLQDNANFRISDPETISINDETLKKKGGSLATDALHEGVHLVDFHTKNALSSSEFAKFWEKMKAESPGFFEEINENKFMPNRPLAGHSQDNSKELLASTVVSLTRKGWETKVEGMPQDFKENYLECLKALQQTVANVPDIPKDASINSELKNKIKTLENMIARA